MEITTEYSLWYIIGCTALAGLYTFILYPKITHTKKKSLIYVLRGFRFISVLLLSFLLLHPFITSWQTRTESPVIILAQDVSTSILNNVDSIYYQTIYLDKLEKFKSKIAKNYTVITMPFGEKVLPDTRPIQFTQRRTNYENLFDEINARYDQSQIGGLILASDGCFNSGASPAYYNFKQSYPIYTIGLGDPRIKSDISIAEVKHNEIVYLDNEFPVNIGVHALMLMGKEAILTISHHGKVIRERRLNITSENDFITEKIILTADQIGAQRYTLSVTPFEDELNKINNQRHLRIDVIDNRDQVLIVANAPHPDIAAIRYALEKRKNMEVSVALIDTLKVDYSAYSLIIAHGIDGINGNENSKSAWKNIWDSKTPLWVILGGQSDLHQINTWDLDFNITHITGKTSEVQAGVNAQFSDFKLAKETMAYLSQCPPIHSPFGEIIGIPKSHISLYQKLGDLVTPTPLLFFTTRHQVSTGWFFGQGFWQWRMYDYQKYNHTAHFDQWVGKIAQYLSVKEDNSRFRIAVEDNFIAGQDVKINATLYNKSFELDNVPNVNITIDNQEGKTFDYLFTQYQDAYTLNLGRLPSGIYHYEAYVVQSDQKFTKNGTFMVSPLNIEWQKTSADFDQLKAISAKSNGQFYLPNEMDTLATLFDDPTLFPAISHTRELTRSILDQKWIFFLILTLWCLEWFIRKVKAGDY